MEILAIHTSLLPTIEILQTETNHTGGILPEEIRNDAMQSHAAIFLNLMPFSHFFEILKNQNQHEFQRLLRSSIKTPWAFFYTFQIHKIIFLILKIHAVKL